jgi:vitamin B12 transporter
MPISIFLAAAAAITGASDGDILVTAALEPVAARDAAVSATIFDQTRIEALGQPLALDLIRLAPGVSVSVSGGPGSQTDIRIRGAESRHSLLYIDGIAFNDPAASNLARFDQAASDSLSRIEIITGPQSALWGSEALGGVIAFSSADPLINGVRASASGEYGSDNFRRGSATVVAGSDRSGVTATGSWLKGDGIDVLGGGSGDKDGFENVTLNFKAVTRPGSDGELGIAGRYVRADIEFDGTDPITFLRADTADASRTETGAVRVWARLGLADDAPWSFQISSQYLHSKNHNRDGATPLNSSTGSRFRTDAQLTRRFTAGDTRHSLIAKIERDDEDFTTADQQYFGATDKDVSRGRTAVMGQWRADWGQILSTDFAVRHDDFNRFKDATTWRANAIAHLTENLSAHAGYGEGIAQPSFIDLYGFFPGNFVGNPNLRPERSEGYEAGIQWQDEHFGVGVTAFSNRLTNEIVSVFNSTTFMSSTANATGRSRRRGIEVTGEVRPLEGLRVSANYTYLDAQEQRVAGAAQLREARRPKHSANLFADYESGPFTLGASLAYVGNRKDTDFDVFDPVTFQSPVVTLKSYVLADARVAYAITPAIEAFARIENAFDEKYQDAVGYATPGRTVYAGIRVRLGD